VTEMLTMLCFTGPSEKFKPTIAHAMAELPAEASAEAGAN